MTDHYLAARHMVDRAEQAIERLHSEHQLPAPNKRTVAKLYDEINQAIALGKIHAQLGVAQAIHDQSMALTDHAELSPVRVAEKIRDLLAERAR